MAEEGLQGIRGLVVKVGTADTRDLVVPEGVGIRGSVGVLGFQATVGTRGTPENQDTRDSAVVLDIVDFLDFLDRRLLLQVIADSVV